MNSSQRQKHRCRRECGSSVTSQRHEVTGHWDVSNVIRFSKGVEWRETH